MILYYFSIFMLLCLLPVMSFAENSQGGAVHVRDFGADGVGDDTNAILAAISSLPTSGGRVLFGDSTGAMTYTVNTEILVKRDKVYLVGLGRNTTIRAGADNMALIRFAVSNGGVQGLTLDCGSYANTTGLRIAPEDETQTTRLVFQTYNTFTDLVITNCTDGVIQRTGPDVGGADSGNWYNFFQHIHLFGNVRGIHLVDHATDPSVSQVNRNNWFDIRIGCPGASVCNVGLHCEACSTNVFTAVHFEGIQFGVSPSATPTAIVIEGQSNAGADNNDNVWFGTIFEGNTRDIFIKNGKAHFNKFIGGTTDPSKVEDNGTGTLFLSANFWAMTAMAYTQTTGRITMSPVNGVHITSLTGASLTLNPSRPHVTASSVDGGQPVLFGNAGIGLTGIIFHRLSPKSANGTIVYCTDCAPNSSPCTGTSTGAIAKRLNDVWDCR